MSQFKLTEIWRYPVKSLRGDRHQQLAVTATGFAHDRHWMVVDAEGLFVTQRQQHRMVLIKAKVAVDGALHLTAPDMPELMVVASFEEAIAVTVWGDTVQGAAIDPSADGWLSNFLGIPCRLVLMPSTTRRRVDPEYAAPADQVGFADGFPFLLISQASLDDLNTRMSAKITMEHFRPNLVVSGCKPYEEDSWQRIRIGELSFRVVKPCSRCVITTIDPDTATRHGVEPLATLSRYRKQGNQVFFGQNLIHDQQGLLNIGQQVEVLE